MKILSPKASLWMPPAYVACLSAITVILSLYEKGPALQGCLVVFVCFMPCAAMMIAQVTQRYVSGLEARIAMLEQQTGKKGV
ncbi:MAG TPA: hypothetical protein VGF85_01680 [Opitutaceae bacterium]|jgi:hypothetical protein